MSEVTSTLDLAELSELKRLLDKTRYSRPWFVGEPFRMGDGTWQDEYIAYGTQGDLSQTYDAIESEPEALELAVAAVNALPGLISALEAAKQRGDYFVDTLARHHTELCRQLGLDPDEAGDEEVFAALEEAQTVVKAAKDWKAAYLYTARVRSSTTLERAEAKQNALFEALDAAAGTAEK